MFSCGGEGSRTAPTTRSRIGDRSRRLPTGRKFETKIRPKVPPLTPFMRLRLDAGRRRDSLQQKQWRPGEIAQWEQVPGGGNQFKIQNSRFKTAWGKPRCRGRRSCERNPERAKRFTPRRKVAEGAKRGHQEMRGVVVWPSWRLCVRLFISSHLLPPWAAICRPDASGLTLCTKFHDRWRLK